MRSNTSFFFRCTTVSVACTSLRSSAAVSASPTCRAKRLSVVYGKLTAPNPESTARSTTPMVPTLFTACSAVNMSANVLDAPSPSL